jgi:hypothetical protein
MKEFLTNEKNKAMWDKNFILAEGDDSVQCCGDDGVWKKAEPLNNDPEIQEFGAITDILKHGYLNLDYKIFEKDSKEPICFISKKPLKLYDVVLLLDGWENFNTFAVFMGTTENDTKYLFKYYHSGSDTIRNYTPNI